MTACRTFTLVLCKNIIYDSKFWNTFSILCEQSLRPNRMLLVQMLEPTLLSVLHWRYQQMMHTSSESKHTKFITPFVSKVNFMHYSWHSIYRCFQQPPSVVSMQRRVLLLTVEGANRSIIIRPIFLSHVCTLKPRCSFRVLVLGFLTLRLAMIVIKAL